MIAAQDDAIKPIGATEEQTAKYIQRSPEELQQLARLAEISERYEDMKGYVEQLVVGKRGDISIHERDLLSIAYKHVVASVRNAHRVVQTIGSKRSNEDEKAIVEEYRAKLKKQLIAVCSELQDLLTKYLIPSAKDDGSKVFYQKMMGDYTRYVAETKGQDEDSNEIVEKSRQAYQQALDLAVQSLRPTDPILLGLVLNFSVFYYEIANAAPEAAQLARKAYDDAVSNLEGLDENAYKDSTMIMELLRENLALWKLDGGTETSDDDEHAVEGERVPNDEEPAVDAPDAMQVDSPREGPPQQDLTEQQLAGLAEISEHYEEAMEAGVKGSANAESRDEPSDKREGDEAETAKDQPPTESS